MESKHVIFDICISICDEKPVSDNLCIRNEKNNQRSVRFIYFYGEFDKVFEDFVEICHLFKNSVFMFSSCVYPLYQFLYSIGIEHH